MAMIPVTIVLETLASLVAEEARLLGGVREGFSELRDDLDSMRSFLQDAENQSEHNQGVRTWVKQVRDVAYDTEDVVDEFLFSLSPSDSKVLSCFIRNSYRYILQLRAKHRLAVQIGTIKRRIKAIAERRKAFPINRLAEASSSSAAKKEWYDPRMASLYIDEADVVGIESPRSTLLEWLVQGEQKLTSISVVGMGGLGKTTLVKKVYDSQTVKRCFDCHSWITVSKSFTLVDLLRALLVGFVETTKDPAYMGIESMRESQLIDVLKNYLQQKRYVIVLDDIWSITAWEAVRYALPECNCGSRIIFTTRLIEFTTSVETTSHVYQLKPLQEKEALNLFCMKTFRGKDKGVCPHELKSLSHSILKKCGGLPLAIVAIGGLLSKKNKNVLEWRKVLDRLAAEMRSDGELANLERILLMSYIDLPYYLKSCYLYVSAFPEDYLIKRTKLIRLWVAERLVEEKHGLNMEEVAQSYLIELVNRSLIQVVEMDDFNRVRTVRVHDIMRELLQKKSREESLIMVIYDSGTPKNEKVRRISIHDSCENLASNQRFSKLRTVLLFIPSGSSLSHTFGCLSSHGFRFLRVLELENAPLSQFPPGIVELVLLRYLSLRKTGIQHLPDSIRKLKNLEVLDLKFSLVSYLPAGILELKCLQQLRNYCYSFKSSIYFPDSYGMTVPTGLGRLTSLQKLGSVEVNENGALVREMANLTQLRRLGILKLREEHGDDLCYTLQRLKHLTGLYMVSINSNEVLQLDKEICPPEYLQRLYLKCLLPTFPTWIKSLQYLNKLVLQNSKLKEDPLKLLQELPSLVQVELRDAYDGEELCCDTSGYPKLKKLGIHQLENLKLVRLPEGAMPHLRGLDITACYNLENVPIGIEHLNNLKHLQLWDMQSTFISRLRPPHGEDFGKVQHISTITSIF